METLKNNKEDRKKLGKLFESSNGMCSVTVKDGVNMLNIGVKNGKNITVLISDKLYTSLQEHEVLM